MARTAQQPTIIDPTQQQPRPVATQRSQGTTQPVEPPMFPPGVEGIQQRTTRTPLVNINRTRVHYESHVIHHAPASASSTASSGGISLGMKVKLIGIAAVAVFLLSQHPGGLDGGIMAVSRTVSDLIGLIFHGQA